MSVGLPRGLGSFAGSVGLGVGGKTMSDENTWTETITWHKFPEVKPTSDSYYLIRYVDEKPTTRGWWDNTYAWEERGIVAWAHLPTGVKHGT